MIKTTATISVIDNDARYEGKVVARLPEAASKKLPSRGMSFVQGNISGTKFASPVEPDGAGSHWFELPKKVKAEAGESVDLEFEVLKEWPEPKVPADLKAALKDDSATDSELA